MTHMTKVGEGKKKDAVILLRPVEGGGGVQIRPQNFLGEA